MKKTINRNNLLEITEKMVKHVSAKPIVPILSCFKISNNEITVDNQEVRVTAQIPKEGDINPLSEVDVCIPARQFVTVLQNMDSDDISLKFDNGKVTVSDKASKKGIVINTFNAGEFWQPQKTDAKTSTYLPISGAHFLPALKKAASFVDGNSASSFDYIGLTVYDEVLHINGGTRPNMYDMRIDIPGIKDFRAMITQKGASALCDIEDTEEVTIERRGSFIFCSNSSISIQARCMEGVYPDIRPFISTIDGKWTTINRKAVIGASNLCATIASETPLILLEKEEGGIMFAAFNESDEVAKQLLECDTEGICTEEGKWYNNSNFKRSLNAIESDMVRMDNKTGVLFLSPDVEPLGVKETVILARVGK